MANVIKGSFESDHVDDLDDFYAPVAGFAEAMIEAGRMNEDRPEDRVARKLVKSGASSLSEKDLSIMVERLLPLSVLYLADDREAFETEFAKRRAPNFYDPPADDRQGDLF